ncbi:MAG: pilus assembly protein [Clostridiales bacterium]|nr:pilus assembly protein [Clostridiales bacterium]
MITGNRKQSKGQTLVETALILPIIILLLMGIVDFGLLFNNYLVVGNAAREGARNAAVGDTDTQIMTIINTATASLDPDKVTVTITPTEASRVSGDEISVTVTYEYAMITPIISSLLGSPIDLTSTTVMRLE